MGAIVVVGSVNQDLHLQVDELPRPGETVLAETVRRTPGGKGANQSVAVARYAGACALLGAVGDDEAGASLVAALTAAHVDTSRIRRLGDTTGTAVVMVDTDGQNAIVVASGANMALTADQVTASLGELDDVATVLSQGELSTDCIAAAATFARTAGARFVLNLAPYRNVTADVLAACNPLIVNEIEAEALAGAMGLRESDPEALAVHLARTCRSVIITLGGRGAVHADRRGAGRVPAPAIDVVDTTGAGDAFVGAATASLTRTGDLIAACRAGVAAGSEAVQHVGAQP